MSDTAQLFLVFYFLAWLGTAMGIADTAPKEVSRIAVWIVSALIAVVWPAMLGEAIVEFMEQKNQKASGE